MSFLDDILDNEPTLAQATVNDDPIVYELIANAAREGNVDTLRSAITRGQVDFSAPIEIVVEIIGIAGNSSRPKLQRMSFKEVQSRMDFLEEWVNLTSPKDPAARQERLDFLLQACFVSIFKFHDASAERLMKMGANPLVATPAFPVVENTSTPKDATQPAGGPGQPGQTGQNIAIIGTAGRDKAMPMTKELWTSMVEHASLVVGPNDTLISGGAAWADHLAVAMFLEGRVKALTLHLPAPMNGKLFAGPEKSAASAANYYHSLFKKATGVDGGAEILEAIARGAKVTHQSEAPGYAAMFARNAIVAKESDSVIAYTFGAGDEPADGGTKNTWDQIDGKKGKRTHVPLGDMPAQIAKAKAATQKSAQSQPIEASKEGKVVVGYRIYRSPPATPPGHQALAFARLGLSQAAGTTLAAAIYAKSAVTGAMVAKAAGKLGENGLPIVAKLSLNTSGKGKKGNPSAIEVNAAAYAIAIGETGQLNAILSALQDRALGSHAVQSSLAQAIHQVKALGLHHFGPDEVHHGIAKVMSFIVDPAKSFATADPSFAHEFVNGQVIAVESPCLKYFDAEGVIIDGEKSLASDESSKAKRVSMAMALLATPQPGAVVGALTGLKALGWNPNEVATFALDGATGGATIAHFAAMRGDKDILACLRAIGTDLKAKDAMGRSPAAYAFSSLPEDGARNFQVASFLDPDEANRLQAEREELRAQQRLADPHQDQRNEVESHRHVQEVLHVPGFPQAHPEGSGAQAPRGGSASPADDWDAPPNDNHSTHGTHGTQGAPGSGHPSKEDAQKVTGQTGRAGGVDIDSVNDLLATAAAERDYGAHDDLSFYDAFEERREAPASEAPAKAEKTEKIERNEVHTKAGAMFAQFRDRQNKAREATGKPLGLAVVAAEAAKAEISTAAQVAQSAKTGTSSANSASSKFKRL